MVLENHRAYNLSHAPHQRITQMLLLDDLKTYHKSDQKATDVLSKLNIGMEWEINKRVAIPKKDVISKLVKITPCLFTMAPISLSSVTMVTIS